MSVSPFFKPNNDDQKSLYQCRSIITFSVSSRPFRPPLRLNDKLRVTDILEVKDKPGRGDNKEREKENKVCYTKVH